MSDAEETGKRPVENQGLVQGQNIGDHNINTQNYIGTQIHIYGSDKKSPPLPAKHKNVPGQLHTHRITRRTFLLLSSAGVATVAIGAGWFELAQRSSKLEAISPPSMTPSSDQTGTEIFPGTPTDVNLITWSPDGHFIALGSSSFFIWVQNVATNQVALKMQQTSFLLSIAWSPDGTKIASGGQDGSIFVWNATTGHLIARAGGTSSPQQISLSWSPDSKKIVDAGAQIWDATTGKLLFTYQGSAETTAWSPSKNSIVSATLFTMDIWDATTGAILTKYDTIGVNSIPQTIAWSPDGEFIAVSYVGGLVCVWDTTSQKLLTQYESENSADRGNIITWSPDSKKIASVISEGIQVWDSMTGKSTSIRGSKDVTCVSWSPDGTKIASEGSSLQMWRTS